MKKLILLALVLVSLSALAALNPILPQNFTTNAGPLQAGSGITFFTNVDKTITISSPGGGSGIATLNGLGTNTTVYSLNDNSFSTALTLWAAPGNLQSENLDLLSTGAHSASIAHFRNTPASGSQKAVDLGLWSPDFGAGFSGSLVFDLYDYDNLGTAGFPGPGFRIQASGKSTVVGDSGVVAHPMLVMSATNGTIDLMLWKADNRVGRTGFHFDPLSGVQELMVGQTNTFTGTGTLSISSRAVTGDGSCKFLTELTIGTAIFTAGGGLVYVSTITSDNAATLLFPGITVAGSAFTVLRPTLISRPYNSISNFFVMQNGVTLSIPGSGLPSYVIRDGAQVWDFIHGGGQFNINNASLGGPGANPFFISDSAPDSSVGIVASGSLSLAQGFKASGASTNLGALTVQGNILAEAVGPSKLVGTDTGTNLSAITIGANLTLIAGTLAATGGGGGGTNMVPVALSFSGGTNVAIVGTLPTGAIGEINYNLTLTTNAYLQVPSGTPVDGQKMIITATMDAVGTWNYLHDTNSAGGYKGGIDLALPLPITTNATFTDIIGYRYNLAKNKWLVTSHVRGY